MHCDEADGAPVTRLYPAPGEACPLAGLYLAHWRDRAPSDARPYVYADFISSLDGRISEAEPRTGRRRVPPVLANARDWRLYMELLAQADVVLTSDRHLRAVAAGRQHDLLRLAEREYPDLVAWRAHHGLAPHPACAAISASLDIPIAQLRERHPAPIVVVTQANAPSARIAEFRACGAEVASVGHSRYIEGAAVIGALAERGYRRIFMIAGPRVLYTVLAADRLARLYLTLVPVMLGGESYDSLLAGPSLSPPRPLSLRELYLDPYAPPGSGQLFACLESRRAANDE